MLVKFLKNAFHPRKRSINPDYIAGEIYPLSEDEAEYFLDRGEAIKITEEVYKQTTEKLKKEIMKRVSFEELLVATGGYGISQIEVSK